MFKSRELVNLALFLMLLIIASQIKLYIGMIPITLQLLVVLLMGLFLNIKQIIVVILTYITLGLIGLPIFSSGGGIAYLISLSFGYIIGFLFLAIIINVFKNKMLGILFGYLSLYMVAIGYADFLLKFVYKSPIPLRQMLVGYWAIFVISDFISILTATIIYKRLKDVIRF